MLGMAPERRELIGRIIQKIEPALVDSVSASQGQPPDPAFLLNAGLQLGVCSTVDMDLMTGMAADTDQLAMITALLEMAETVADQRLTRYGRRQHNTPRCASASQRMCVRSVALRARRMVQCVFGGVFGRVRACACACVRVCARARACVCSFPHKC